MKQLRPINLNVGIKSAYSKGMRDLLKETHKSIVYWLSAVYKKNEDRILAEDASPTTEITDRFKQLQNRWISRWKDESKKLAWRFVNSTMRSLKTGLTNHLNTAKVTVAFNPSRALNSTARALYYENVRLIRSIPEQYLNDVYGILLRGITQRQGFKDIRKELTYRYGVTNRRAAFIVRDQTHKANESMSQVAYNDLGIRVGRWKHHPGRKTSRYSHERMDGKYFLINDGLYDSEVKKNVKPGELPGCMCTLIPVFFERETPEEIAKITKELGL